MAPPIVNDPDAKKPAKPTKKSAPVKAAPPKILPNLKGPADPANQPGNYFGQHGESDNGDYIGSPSMPGFILGQADRDQNAYSPQEYRNWLYGAGQAPAFDAMRKKYGDAFVAYSWFAFRTGIDPNDALNDMSVKFPGFQEYLASYNSSGDGSRSYGGGGGGGMTKAQQYDAAAAAIRNQSDTYGMQLADTDVMAIAHTVVDGNWSGDQLTDYLLGNTAGATRPGTIASTAEQLKAMAANQLVTVSEATIADWTKRILSGEMSQDTVSLILMQQAQSEFGWAADALKVGATMRDVLAPTRDTIARELEMNPAEVDLMDPKWRKMVQTTNPDGAPRGESLTVATAAARKDARYADTAGAARLGAQTATILRNVFEG